MKLYEYLTTHFGIRGSINAIGTYLGEYQLSAQEYVKLHPQVALGLLKALGLENNSVALPTEDTASFVMSATENLFSRIEPQDINGIEFIEVGTESLNDGSLPLSQYALALLNDMQSHEENVIDDVMSTESKHACIGALNAIWKNLGDNGIVIAADIAIYNDDKATAASADFTGGAGAIGMHLLPGARGQLLDVFNVRGVSAGLTYDFFKPYRQQGMNVESNTYPVVFGSYSNLANIERVARAYMNLMTRVDSMRLDDFSGIVLHAPYPGITKYNLAALFIIDQAIDNSFYMERRELLFRLIKQSHDAFEVRDFAQIARYEREVKILLKEVMADSTHDFGKLLMKIKPSLKFISQTGNLYTGSSPLCMLSLLEEGVLETDDLILWGGYGSGNQALFMIGAIKETTKEIVSTYNTQGILDSRGMLPATYYQQIKYTAGSSEMELLATDINGLSGYITPNNAFFLSSRDEFGIGNYQKQVDDEVIPLIKIRESLRDIRSEI